LAEEIDRANADPSASFVVLDAAVLFEAGWNEMCNKVVFVEAPREIRFDRVRNQRGWSESEFTAREQSQMPLAEKRHRADVVIHNHGSQESLSAKVEFLIAQLHPMRESVFRKRTH
jgi:dephospho-CoA kinase